MKILFTVDRLFGLNKDRITVLCYHSFSNKYNKYSVGLPLFEKEIEKILRFAKFVSIDDIFKAGINGHSVVLTVDDGYEDVMKILPITEKYKIPVTLFILSSPKNANRKELDHKGGLLNTKQIKQLISKGWGIGSHSATHGNFNGLTEKEMEKEIVESKRTLEKKLGIKVKYFAYPKGVYNKKIVHAVKKAGYKAAFSAEPNQIHGKRIFFALPRVVIDSSFTIYDFPALYSKSTLLTRRLIGKL